MKELILRGGGVMTIEILVFILVPARRFLVVIQLIVVSFFKIRFKGFWIHDFYFLNDLENVSKIIGVRLGNIDEELIKNEKKNIYVYYFSVINRM